MHTPEKKQVLKAISDLGRRVTSADVATKTGLALSTATSQLNTIASETGGHLQVATTGDIAYSFPAGFQSAYLAQGAKKVMLDIWEKAFNIGFFLLRISFGIMLILSLIIVAVLIWVMMQRMSRGDGGGRGGGFHFRFGFFDYLILRDLLWWGAYSSSGHRRSQYDYYGRRIDPSQQKSNFLLDCFSFLFGDGNPNEKIEEERWRLVAETIKRGNGVTTVDQLAPYIGADPANEDSALPALVRFNGRPEVTEEGNMVYVFPALQVSASGASSRSLPLYLKESLWKFSNAKSDSLMMVFILAGINFLGSWWLWLNMNRVPELYELWPLILCLVVYGTMFVVVPTVRYLAIQLLNGRIDQRNKERQSFARRISNPEDKLLNKLKEAQSYKIKELKIDDKEIVYSTERDALEQEFDASP